MWAGSSRADSVWNRSTAIPLTTTGITSTAEHEQQGHGPMGLGWTASEV